MSSIQGKFDGHRHPVDAREPQKTVLRGQVRIRGYLAGRFFEGAKGFYSHVIILKDRGGFFGTKDVRRSCQVRTRVDLILFRAQVQVFSLYSC